MVLPVHLSGCTDLIQIASLLKTNHAPELLHLPPDRIVIFPPGGTGHIQAAVLSALFGAYLRKAPYLL